MRSFLIGAIIAVLILVFAHPTATANNTVIEKQYIVVATDSQRIQLFIDELLTPKSAKCFRKILDVESHENPLAKSPTTGAFGVAQLLDSTYRNLGMKAGTKDPLAQIVASLAYTSERYGSAGTCGAWKHEVKFNWY